MALTNAQQVQIRTYMGWPPYATWDTTLESVMQIVGGDADMTAIVVAILANIASVETEIAGLHGLAIADSAEGNKLNPRRYEDLRGAGRREVLRLCAMMNLDGPRRDVFSAGGIGVALPMG